MLNVAVVLDSEFERINVRHPARGGSRKARPSLAVGIHEYDRALLPMH